MVAKINVGSSLYGALAYNGEKINEGQGRLLATNKIFDEGTGCLDIRQAAEDFARYMPEQVRTAKPVVHISLNPHPDDRLGDTELTAIAEEYLARLGYGDQPYAIFKHEDIDRHHLHIVTLCVDGQGKKIGDSFLHRRSKNITRALEQQYALHPAERKRQPQHEPLRRVDALQGDVKKQIGSVLKGISGRYRFQSLGEYRALLALYNITVEECRGEVRGREYGGRWCAISKEQMKEWKTGDITKATVLAALRRTKDRTEFVAALKAKGVDVVLRETDTGRIYGATFIDHRTGCVLNGSRMGKEFSANALQEHFAPPAPGVPLPIDLPQPSAETTDKLPQAAGHEVLPDALGLFAVDTGGADAEEQAFMREMQRRNKKKKKQRKI